MSAKLLHELHSHVEMRHRDGLLFRYVYEPEADEIESPKPYFHPLRTLAGDEVTIYRPHDHAWHKGLSMTASHLSGQNFWGGPTFVPGKGYVQLDNNGKILHRSWADLLCERDTVGFEELLEWVVADRRAWIAERRSVRVSEINEAEGFWSLDLRFQLENQREQPLVFGSPTTEGRPEAGYGGLFWRGPRSFRQGTILAAGGSRGPETMGRPAAWLAYTGKHDGSLRRSTVLFLDSPANPRFPNKWFVRSDPFACISCSFMFDEQYTLAPRDTLTLEYRVVVCNGEWSLERLEALAEAWQRRGHG